MLRYFACISLFLSLSFLGFAQGGEQYFSDNANALIYGLPRTSIKVTLTTQRHTIQKGELARYAQKYLGVVAPLSDKDTYTLKHACISSFAEGDPSEFFTVNTSSASLQALIKQTGSMPIPKSEVSLPQRFNLYEGVVSPIGTEQIVPNDTILNKVAEDKVSANFSSEEQRASELANLIFTLRARRMELITGETGENVFGAGLGAALDEIARLESEYLAMFMGKSTYSQVVKQYELLPKKGVNTYVVARMSETKGVVSSTDLSASPIVLELTPETFDAKINLPRAPIVQNTKEVIIPEYIKYRVAAPTTAKIYYDNTELLQTRLLVYQFGVTLDLPINTETKK